MPSRDIHHFSLRDRLVIGVGAMLLPLIALAGGAYLSFEGAIGTFERTENRRLEELFPLAQLDSLLSASNDLVENPTGIAPSEASGRYRALSQNIDATIFAMLASPSQLPEKHTLLLQIQKKWLAARTDGDSMFLQTSVLTNTVKHQRIKSFDRSVTDAKSDVQQLNYLLSHLQTMDNLAQASQVKQSVRQMIAIAFLFAIAIVALSAKWLAQHTLVPMRMLQAGVSRFGEGDLSYRIQLTSQDELAALATSFNTMAQTLEKSQADLTRLATLDGLTGVYNRREFNRWLTLEIDRSRREFEPVSLLMVDIDHFKKLNDTYGHQAGDEALRCVGRLLLREVRPGDHVARYGGEEFSIILPKASSADAFTIAERIRAAIEAQVIPLSLHQSLTFTASLGFATLHIDRETEEAFAQRADRALYYAKHNGRNRVSSAEEALRPVQSPKAA
jgi:two-component system, cell cycle response regulator